MHVHANMKMRAEIVQKLHECAYPLRAFSCEIQACLEEKRAPAIPHALWALSSEKRQVLPQLLFDVWPGFATILLDMLGHGLAENDNVWVKVVNGIVDHHVTYSAMFGCIPDF